MSGSQENHTVDSAEAESIIKDVGSQTDQDAKTARLLVQEELKRQAADTSAISSQSNTCMSLYQRLFVELHEATHEQCRENKFDRDLTLARVGDARARFKAWAVSIAAFQSGHLRSSLDYRLKDASEIRERILKILAELQESLLTGKIPPSPKPGLLTLLLFSIVLTLESNLDC